MVTERENPKRGPRPPDPAAEIRAEFEQRADDMQRQLGALEQALDRMGAPAPPSETPEFEETDVEARERQSPSSREPPPAPLHRPEQLWPQGVVEDTQLDVTAGTGVAVMERSTDWLVGRIPARLHSFSREWFINESVDPVAWSDMTIEIAGSYGASGIEMPCFGKITELVLEFEYFGAHAAGVMDFRLWNITTGDATDSPQIDNLAGTLGDQNVSDGLAVNWGDKVRLECRGADVGANQLVVAATFTLEEQCAYVVTGAITPDARGVYVRLGQYGGVPCYERVDGAYWLYWITAGDAGWYLGRTLGDVTNYWIWAGTNIVSAAYTAAGTYTGTATVAAQAD